MKTEYKKMLQNVKPVREYINYPIDFGHTTAVVNFSYN